jgi:putative spermidine/putrescine transport system substrate-binding protein
MPERSGSPQERHPVIVEITMPPWTRAISLIMEGEPLAISYEGAALPFEAWVVPTGAPNADNAMKFINWALQPKPQAELTDPENVRKGFFLNGDWWAPNLDKVTEAWNEWRLRQEVFP